MLRSKGVTFENILQRTLQTVQCQLTRSNEDKAKTLLEIWIWIFSDTLTRIKGVILRWSRQRTVHEVQITLKIHWVKCAYSGTKINVHWPSLKWHWYMINARWKRYKAHWGKCIQGSDYQSYCKTRRWVIKSRRTQWNKVQCTLKEI